MLGRGHPLEGKSPGLRSEEMQMPDGSVIRGASSPNHRVQSQLETWGSICHGTDIQGRGCPEVGIASFKLKTNGKNKRTNKNTDIGF